MSEYMREIKPDTYTQTKNLISDWSDKENYLVQYGMLKFYVRYGKIVDKVHEIISFKKSKWLEKYTNYNTQKRNQSRFWKGFLKIIKKNAFYGKIMENVRNRLEINLFKMDDYREIVKQQS